MSRLVALLPLIAIGCTLPLEGLGQGDGPCVATAELCNLRDDDCDGEVDEELTRSCGSVGTCAEGRQRCVNGVLDACQPRTDWPDEVCGGGDEDCDTAIDEGCGCEPPGSSRACGSDVGECEAGTQTCGDDRMWGECTGGAGESPEICDNRDNDCDGTVDGFTLSCGSAMGICTEGTQTCTGGVLSECSGVVAQPVDLCDAMRLDENCDGQANEGCMCDEGQTEPCGSGACVGTRRCDANGVFGDCAPTTIGTETCNGLDDDCDSVIDNDATADCRMTTDCDVVRRGAIVYLFCWQRPMGTDMRRDYNAARAFCAGVGPGYHLVTVDDASENNFLAREMETRRRSDFWIGYHDQDDDGTYTWDFPQVVMAGMMPYENWRSGPAADKCAALDSDPSRRDWEDKNCTDSRAFVCEAVPAP